MRLVDADALLMAIATRTTTVNSKNINKNEMLDLITNAPTVQREGWVSVEDRLPEKMDNYLLFSKGNTNFRDFIQIGIYSEAHGGFLDKLGGNPHIPVTHWQPLPAAPKE